MSNPGDEDRTPVESVQQLAGWMAAGGKKRADWRIGTEHEKFGFSRRDLAPIGYEKAGIRAVLEGLAPLGWKRIEDGGRLIGLGQDGRSVSLEPGGQLELSGAPVADLHATKAEMAAHFAELREVAGPMFVGFAPLGFHPTATRAEMPMMPKSRYDIMKRYMPQVGSMGLDMMLRTCTVQVNLDYADERDMVRKLRVSALLQPVATALFANSPFVEGRPSGYLSYRAHVWTDVDRARSGLPDAYLEDGFGFERCVDWVLDVPMYFVAREGKLLDAAGLSFRKWIAGSEERLAHLRPTLGDFADHMTTAFPDVRIKRFLEMRGADAGSPEMMLAQSALWVGLLYDDSALAAAEAVVAEHGVDELRGLRALVPREGLSAKSGRASARQLAEDMVEIAAAGLDARGADEGVFLEPLQAIAEGAPSQAEYWLQRFSGTGPGAGRVGEMLIEAAV